MPTESATARAQAIAWHIRLRDGQAGHGDEFADWLVLDPRHSTAYDEVALADREIEPALCNWANSQTNDHWLGLAHRWIVRWRRAGRLRAHRPPARRFL
ncbi:DUF4880 domain-containing protein [Sphingomonas sp.]|uniref:FecR/PupR family sigma factor regulator n=1 Tax=Sphingomonas sp. TaxID=28214 RepID=UPI00286D4CBC|nr:DUF4880 domain-containing protein [Sphingomonas sp.]